MPPRVGFYFDFMSPCGYLGIERSAFGSRRFAVGNALFWGHHRRPHLECWIVNGPYVPSR